MLSLTVLVAGCGGDDEGGETTASSLNKAEFIEQADEACTKGDEQIQADFAAYIKEHEDVQNPTEADYAELVETVLVPNVKQEVADLRALGVPSGDEKQVEAVLDAREESVRIAKADPEALIKNGQKVFAKAIKLANAYGFKVCGMR